MSTKYKDTKSVPTSVIADRLDEISDAVAGGRESLWRETTMRVPAECDRDADLVLAEAARRLKDPRLSQDPLTALAAVMREHKMEFLISATGGCDTVPQFSIDCEDKYGDLFSLDGFATLGADNIKPESSNEIKQDKENE